jgi:hypothetical protein
MAVEKVLIVAQANAQEPYSSEQGWRPIWTAPVNKAVLVRVVGESEPVVAVCDKDRCWQVAWTGDLLHRPMLWQPIPGLTAR